MPQDQPFADLDEAQAASRPSVDQQGSPNLGAQPQQNPPSQGGMTYNDLLNIFRGGAQQPPAPAPNKAQKLMQILKGGLTGAASGMQANAQTYAATGRNAGFGGGFGAGFLQTVPYQQALQTQNVQRGNLENQLLDLQTRTALPQTLFALLKSNADINKSTAEANAANANAGKATAEAGAIPTREALEQAQAEAANYKDDPNVGLIDLRTKQPVTSAGLAPLTAEEAPILGKQPGDLVPLKLKNTANEIVNRGIRQVQANGRSLLVDNQGNTIKDMGVASPMAVINAQMGVAGNPQSPEYQAVVDAVGQGKMDLQTAVARMGRFPGASFGLMSAIEQKYPNYFQGNYDAAKKVLDSFTSGSYSQNLNAIDTARRHMQTFNNLAGQLDNGSVRSFNALGNAIGVQFGSDSVTNFNIARQFFSGEVGKAVVAGGGTAGERDQLAESINNASSWKQLSGALKTADELLSGKQKALKDTFKSGMNATPNFGQADTSGGGSQPPDPFTAFGGRKR